MKMGITIQVNLLLIQGMVFGMRESPLLILMGMALSMNGMNLRIKAMENGMLPSNIPMLTKTEFGMVKIKIMMRVLIPKIQKVWAAGLKNHVQMARMILTKNLQTSGMENGTELNPSKIKIIMVSGMMLNHLGMIMAMVNGMFPNP